MRSLEKVDERIDGRVITSAITGIASFKPKSVHTNSTTDAVCFRQKRWNGNFAVYKAGTHLDAFGVSPREKVWTELFRKRVPPI
jgi:hypothetical protein